MPRHEQQPKSTPKEIMEGLIDKAASEMAREHWQGWDEIQPTQEDVTAVKHSLKPTRLPRRKLEPPHFPNGLE